MLKYNNNNNNNNKSQAKVTRPSFLMFFIFFVLFLWCLHFANEKDEFVWPNYGRRKKYILDWSVKNKQDYVDNNHLDALEDLPMWVLR